MAILAVNITLTSTDGAPEDCRSQYQDASEEPEQRKCLDASTELFFQNKFKKEISARVLISGAPYAAVPSALNVSARVLILAISEECLSSRAH